MRAKPLFVWAGIAGLALLAAGCARDTDSLRPAPPNDDPIVFDDTFGDGVDYQAFLGSKVDAVDIDPSTAAVGLASLRVTVPAPGNADGTYAGGAFTVNLARTLVGYNALTFWAKASKASVLDVAGFGNDNTGTSLYEASLPDIPLTTDWTKFTIPIPVPGKLSSERGLFYMAEGPEGDEGHQVWFDQVQFAVVNTIANPRPRMSPQNLTLVVGQTVVPRGTRTIFEVNGQDLTILHSPDYFTFQSDDESVVSVVNGVPRVVGGGSAVLTARLDAVDAVGQVNVTAIAPPGSAAPTPGLPAGDVISLFSGAYTNRTVDTWSATWDAADVLDLDVQGNAIKAYTNLVFAGIEFTSQPIDASAMTRFHMDLWIPEGQVFRIKLVDFGNNGIFGGGDDSEHELTVDSGFDPPLVPGSWVQLDIPLSDFTNLKGTANLAQLIVSGDSGTAFLDNIYFHK